MGSISSPEVGTDTAKLWDLQGQEVQAFSGHSDYVSSVAFSPDGQYILTWK